MEDGNLIARLYPKGGFFGLDDAYFMVQMRENRPHRFREPRVSPTKKSADDERGAKGAKEEACLYREGLQLCFDSPRRNKEGFLIGGSKDCDIVLPTHHGLASVSDYHCLITFDRRGRLVIRDLRGPSQAKNGTVVMYGGEGGFTRTGFTWILSGEHFTSRPIQIWLHARITFILEVAPHDILSAEYRRKVTEFRKVGVDSRISKYPRLQALLASTVLYRQPPILLDDVVLGRGGQAVVRKVWDVSTGKQYASKEPLDIRESHWRRFQREAEILQKIRHNNIVQCLLVTEIPKRRVLFEYIPLGSLHSQALKQPITSSENIEILTQGLAALRFLHELEKPIAHRDVKPDNILVCSRDPLHIKLSDFGVSKKTRDLKTYIGTDRYMAPEVMFGGHYDESVDIWSLGLVALQFAHGFPPCRVTAGPLWAQQIVQHLGDHGACGLLMFLKSRMLRVEPRERSCASTCFHVAGKMTASSCCARRAAMTGTGSSEDGTSQTTVSTTTVGRSLIKDAESKQLVPRKRMLPKSLGQIGCRKSLRIAQRRARRVRPYASSSKPKGQALKRKRGAAQRITDRPRGRSQRSRAAPDADLTTPGALAG